MKITAALFAALPAILQSSFTKLAAPDAEGNEYDNGEENPGALKSALEAERNQRNELGKKVATFDAEKARIAEEAKAAALEEHRKSGNVAEIEKVLRDEIQTLKKAATEQAAAILNGKKQAAIDAAVDELSKNFTSPAMAKAFIKQRLKADVIKSEDGTEEAIAVRVLDKAGKLSPLTVEELKKEFLTDPDLKASITATKGGGGGATTPGVREGLSTATNGDKPFDAAKASASEMIAHLESKGAVNVED